MIKEITTPMLILTNIENKVYFYVPAEEGKKRLRVAIADCDVDKETMLKAQNMKKLLRRYYTVIKDSNEGFKIKLE